MYGFHSIKEQKKTIIEMEGRTYAEQSHPNSYIDPRTIIENCIEFIINFVQSYGWHILFVVVVYYFLQPYIMQKWKDMSRKANLPSQRKEYDESVRIARLAQQREIDLLKSNKDPDENKSSEQGTPKIIPVIPKVNEKTHASSYSLLTGAGGHVNSFKPSGDMRKRGRRS